MNQLPAELRTMIVSYSPANRFLADLLSNVFYNRVLELALDNPSDFPLNFYSQMIASYQNRQCRVNKALSDYGKIVQTGGTPISFHYASSSFITVSTFANILTQLMEPDVLWLSGYSIDDVAIRYGGINHQLHGLSIPIQIVMRSHEISDTQSVQEWKVVRIC